MARSYALTDVAAPPHPAIQLAAREAILGKRRGWRALLPFLGPAFIASIAYIDPGNFATNIAGGAQFGYALLWVILMANLMAMLIQGLAAKLGIATGMNLAEMCRARYPRWLCYAFWVTQETTAMATDLAEFLGAAIGINLLFGIPMFGAALITGVGVFLILTLQGKGFRGLEVFIGGCAGVIALCYIVETVLAKPDWGQVAYHSVVPSLPGSDAVLLAVGIIGATVMPHVIYLHSALTQGRVVPGSENEAQRVFAFEKIDVIIAMAVAGLVNMAMLYMAAKVFHFTGHTDVAEINTAYQTLTPLLGKAAAVVFGIALVTSGISSSHVGTMAGQVVMQGFVNFRTPIWLRRIATMVPALVAIYLGLEPTRTLVISQVVLSFTLPIPIITLILFTSNPVIMGKMVNHRVTTVLAGGCAAIILLLNVVLLYQTFGGTLSL
ncbi:MAG: divalent metal cation transporter [Armatimonadetes bacterium 13_1_40CM_64_14]|nr:MAG: divalent metal cation transporter [Armatimonadetes bacterium 13_1_40CM_64_14]